MKGLIFLILTLVVFPTGVAFAQTEFVVVAGGCFWCVEEAFDKHEGVLSTTSGFAGGHVENPSYRQVTAGGTGHIEVVRIEFDPAIISFDEILYIYWRNIDPIDAGGQFCDRGESYTTAIFYVSEEQRVAAERTKQEVSRRFSTSVATTIRPYTEFYSAEEYHQDYHTKNPVRYWYYRTACGRYDRLDQLWGDEARGE
ncbi:MAG: peptide-methionine (S)-S-oxide reductase MsrA [Spirochaetales bacterium]|nr:peptide-methionine (S)-S-oxide reductase MsrA [Spirochaetales bacterium]